MKEAANLAKKKDIETGFFMLKKPGSDYFYSSPVFEGNKRSLETKDDYKKEQCYPFISTHFHVRGCHYLAKKILPAPSIDDLKLLFYKRKEALHWHRINVKPIEAICANWPKEEITLFLIQEKSEKVSYKEIRGFQENLHDILHKCCKCCLLNFFENSESDSYNLRLLRFKSNKYDDYKKLLAFSCQEKSVK